ncbi:sugar ABC transporter substrate-binding protein [Nonomuraea sp. SMC257]|uniref:Sugar ABC transporter substrate-binding protein n=1 Tax=Nonomuraea montanisoli TaxID=2741721 RepID=A0A7Y6IAF7_9ACTN|nr:sugar ABC transporter substrate-binding protein [Nonomuraea montanisoli]
MSRTKIAGLAVVTAAALALTACGRGSTTSSSDPVGSALSSGPAKGTITMWAQGAEGAALPSLVKEFEAANPGVKVNITAIPWDAAHNKYQTAISGGTTPDVAQMGTTWMADFSTAFDPTPKQVDTSGFFEGAKAATMINGASLGVPWYVDTNVIYYRTDLAAKAGYTSPPTNWADLKAMAKAMQEKAGAKWGMALTPGGADSFQLTLPFIWSNGASLMNADGTKWTFDTPEMAGALKYYQSFFTEGISDKNLSTAAGAKESAFVSGATPMLVNGPFEIGQLNQAGGADFDKKYGVMRFPKQKSSTSFVGGSALVVFKKSKNRDAAWKLIQWLSKADVQAKWQKMVGDLPAVQAAWNDPALAGDEKLSVFKEQLQDVKSPPANTSWTQVGAAADTMLEQIVKAGTDPAAALKDLQAKADSIGTGG